MNALFVPLALAGPLLLGLSVLLLQEAGALMKKLPLSWHVVLQLAGKELRSLWRDRLLLLFVVWAFSGAIYTAATAMPDRLVRAPSRSSTRTRPCCRSG